MPEATQPSHSPLTQQILQMALELAGQLERAAQQAPPGGALRACEDLLLGQGRQFLRDSLAAALQHQAEQAEKKGGPRAPARADTPPAATRALAPASS